MSITKLEIIKIIRDKMLLTFSIIILVISLSSTIETIQKIKLHLNINNEVDIINQDKMNEYFIFRDEIIELVNIYKNSTLLSDKNTFAYKEASLLNEYYCKLNINESSNKIFDIYFSSDLNIVLTVILIVYLSYKLLGFEIDKKYFNYMNTILSYRNKRKKITYILICIICFSFYVLLEVFKFIIISVSTKINFDFNLQLQTIPRFLYCPFQLSIFEYLVLKYLLVLLLIASLIIMLSFFAKHCEDSKFYCIICAIVFYFSFLMHTQISQQSIYSLFKYFNFSNIFYIDNLFESLVLVKILKYPIVSYQLVIIYNIFTIVLFYYLYTLNFKFNLIKIEIPKTQINNFNLLELKKIIIVEKNYVFIALLIFFINVFVNHQVLLTMDEYYYSYFSNELTGEINKISDNKIKVIEKTFKDTHKNYIYLLNKDSKTTNDYITIKDLQSIIRKEKGFTNAKNSYIQSKNENNHEFVNDFSLIKTVKNNLIYLYLFVTYAFFYMIIGNVSSYDSVNGLYRYLSTIDMQIKRVRKIHMILLITLGIAITTLIYFKILNLIGFINVNLSINQISIFRNLPNITIKNSLIYFYIMLIFSNIFIIKFIYLSTKKMKNSISVYFYSCGISAILLFIIAVIVRMNI